MEMRGVLSAVPLVFTAAGRVAPEVSVPTVDDRCRHASGRCFSADDGVGRFNGM